MRLTTVVVMVAMMGCAGHARREFRDGAPVRAAPVEPVTTYTPVGAGLPEYWGSPAPSMERSPHSRALPETDKTRREDGLWAAKDSELETVHISIAGVSWDVVVVDADDSSAKIARTCEEAVNLVLNTHQQVRDAVHALSEAERRCFSTLTYFECTGFKLGEYRQKMTESERGGFPPGKNMKDVEYGLAVAHGAASHMVDLACLDGATKRADDAARLWSLAAYTYPRGRMQ